MNKSDQEKAKQIISENPELSLLNKNLEACSDKLNSGIDRLSVLVEKESPTSEKNDKR